MRFLGTKFTQNALATGAKALPRIPCRFQGALRGRGEGKEGKDEGGGKEEKGYWGKERGREGKGGGMEREGGGKERGGGVCVIGVRGDRRP